MSTKTFPPARPGDPVAVPTDRGFIIGRVASVNVCDQIIDVECDGIVDSRPKGRRLRFFPLEGFRESVVSTINTKARTLGECAKILQPHLRRNWKDKLKSREESYGLMRLRNGALTRRSCAPKGAAGL